MGLSDEPTICARIPFDAWALHRGADCSSSGQRLGGFILTWNRGAERIFGYRPEDILGQDASTLYDIGGREQSFRRMLDVAAATGRQAIPGYRRRRDGVRMRTDGVITAMRDASGTLLGFGEISRPVD